MGLMLSVLVMCVGVLEAISCVQHVRESYLPLEFKRRKRRMVVDLATGSVRHADISWPGDVPRGIHVIRRRSGLISPHSSFDLPDDDLQRRTSIHFDPIQLERAVSDILLEEEAPDDISEETTSSNGVLESPARLSTSEPTAPCSVPINEIRQETEPLPGIRPTLVAQPEADIVDPKTPAPPTNRPPNDFHEESDSATLSELTLGQFITSIEDPAHRDEFILSDGSNSITSPENSKIGRIYKKHKIEDEDMTLNCARPEKTKTVFVDEDKSINENPPCPLTPRPLDQLLERSAVSDATTTKDNLHKPMPDLDPTLSYTGNAVDLTTMSFSLEEKPIPPKVPEDVSVHQHESIEKLIKSANDIILHQEIEPNRSDGIKKSAMFARLLGNGIEAIDNVHPTVEVAVHDSKPNLEFLHSSEPIHTLQHETGYFQRSGKCDAQVPGEGVAESVACEAESPEEFSPSTDGTRMICRTPTMVTCQPDSIQLKDSSSQPSPETSKHNEKSKAESLVTLESEKIVDVSDIVKSSVVSHAADSDYSHSSGSSSRLSRDASNDSTVSLGSTEKSRKSSTDSPLVENLPPVDKDNGLGLTTVSEHNLESKTESKSVGKGEDVSPQKGECVHDAEIEVNSPLDPRPLSETTGTAPAPTVSDDAEQLISNDRTEKERASDAEISEAQNSYTDPASSGMSAYQESSDEPAHVASECISRNVIPKNRSDIIANDPLIEKLGNDKRKSLIDVENFAVSTHNVALDEHSAQVATSSSQAQLARIVDTNVSDVVNELTSILSETLLPADEAGIEMLHKTEKVRDATESLLEGKGLIANDKDGILTSNKAANDICTTLENTGHSYIEEAKSMNGNLQGGSTEDHMLHEEKRNNSFGTKEKEPVGIPTAIGGYSLSSKCDTVEELSAAADSRGSSRDVSTKDASACRNLDGRLHGSTHNQEVATRVDVPSPTEREVNDTTEKNVTLHAESLVAQGLPKPIERQDLCAKEEEELPAFSKAFGSNSQSGSIDMKSDVENYQAVTVPGELFTDIPDAKKGSNDFQDHESKDESSDKKEARKVSEPEPAEGIDSAHSLKQERVTEEKGVCAVLDSTEPDGSKSLTDVQEEATEENISGRIPAGGIVSSCDRLDVGEKVPKNLADKVLTTGELPKDGGSTKPTSNDKSIPTDRSTASEVHHERRRVSALEPEAGEVVQMSPSLPPAGPQMEDIPAAPDTSPDKAFWVRD